MEGQHNLNDFFNSDIIFKQFQYIFLQYLYMYLLSIQDIYQALF